MVTQIVKNRALFFENIFIMFKYWNHLEKKVKVVVNCI